MIEVKFSPCDAVVYFNTAERKVMRAEVKSARVIPTAISKDENGANKLVGSVVLYETVDGPVLAESECFASEAECRETYRKIFAE